MDKYEEENSNSEELNNLEVKINPANDFLYFLVDLLKTGVIVFLLAFSLRFFVVQPFIVDGESMMPNFVNEEYLLVEKVNYMIDQPKRGDVVVFRYPGNPNVNYIKRIIALPNEKVKIESNQVLVYNTDHRDGIVLDEKYLPLSDKTFVSGQMEFEQKLGEGEYFVMGDNRQHSSDSREWGSLPKSNIVGRAWLTIKPLDRLQIHHRMAYPSLTMENLFFGRALAAK